MQLNYSKRKWFDWVCMHHTLSTVAQCKQMDRHTSFVSRKNSHENVNTSDLKLKRWCKALSSSRRQGHISNSTAPVYYMHCIMNTNFFFFSFFRIFWSVPIKLFTTIFRRLIKLPSTTFTHLSSESVSVDVANKAYTKKKYIKSKTVDIHSPHGALCLIARKFTAQYAPSAAYHFTQDWILHSFAEWILLMRFPSTTGMLPNVIITNSIFINFRSKEITSQNKPPKLKPRIWLNSKWIFDICSERLF